MDRIYGIRYAQQVKEKIKKEKTIFFRNNRFSNFKNITEEKKDEIFDLTFIWNEKNKDLFVLEEIFNIYYYLNNSKKNKFTSDEAFLFLIFSIDPEFKLLKIFYEESTIHNIKKRFEEEFGFKFDNRLLILEKAYNNKFPTIIDEYSLEKK